MLLAFQTIAYDVTEDLDFQEIAILDQLGLKIAYDAKRGDLD